MVPEPANYADSRLEKAANDTVFQQIQLAVEQQAKGEPVDKFLALKTIEKIRDLIIQGFDAARLRFFELQSGRDEQPLRPNSFRGVITDHDIALWDANFEIAASPFHSNRPTQFRSLVELSIDLGQSLTQSAEAKLSDKHELDQHVARLEVLAK